MARVEADKTEAAALGITGTPTFLIGKVEPDGVRVAEIITGVKKVQTFRKVLDQLLNK